MTSRDETEEGKGHMSFSSTVDRGVAFAIGGILEFVLFFFLIYAAAKGQLTLTIFIVFGALLSFFIVLHLLLLIDTSGLLVSDDGVARKLFGRRCLRIQWNRIGCIRGKRLGNPTLPAEFCW